MKAEGARVPGTERGTTQLQSATASTYVSLGIDKTDAFRVQQHRILEFSNIPLPIPALPFPAAPGLALALGARLRIDAARFRDYYDRQAKERHEKLSGRPSDGKPKVNLPEDRSQARDAAGVEFGVSGKSVDFATKVLEEGVPELVDAVDQGRIQRLA